MRSGGKSVNANKLELTIIPRARAGYELASLASTISYPTSSREIIVLLKMSKRIVTF